MFNIDKASLTTAIAISLAPNLQNVEDKNSEYIKYFLVTLDMVLGVMNSEVRNTWSAIDEQVERYSDDKNIPWLCETVSQLVTDIKVQFSKAGFDGRMKYKLVTRAIGMHKLYAIAMDLDATVLAINEDEERTDKDPSATELSYVISEEPTIDQLNAAFNW